MPNLQIKGIDDQLYAELKMLASEENRSVSQQVLFLFKDYLARKKHMRASKTPAQVLLDLSGSWKDGQDSAALIAKIKKARKNSKRWQWLGTGSYFFQCLSSYTFVFIDISDTAQEGYIFRLT